MVASPAALLAAHLLEIGITMEMFEEFVENATAQLHHLLVEQLLSVEDFQTFKAMMVKRNVQQVARRATHSQLRVRSCSLKAS